MSASLFSTVRVALLLLPLLLTAAASAAAQGAAAGTLTVEVTDTVGGVLPGATVTVTGPLPATTETMLVANGEGKVEMGGLAPGVYRVLVELPGFEPVTLEDVAIVAGRTQRRTVTLGLATFAEQVSVTVDAVDRRLDENFTETYTAEEIEALPDDPDEAMLLIEQLAGPDAEIRVNGFEGGSLPPKSQIQAIRVRQDPFAADTHGAGRPRVDIITKPGSSHWEHHFNAGLRDQSLDARNAFAPERGEGQTRRLRWSSSGPLVKDRTSLAFSLSTRHANDLNPILATRPDGAISDAVNQESRRFDAEVRLEHALTPTHMLRLEYQNRNGEQDNLGVGQFNLPERAYDATDNWQLFRASNIGTFGKKVLNELRFELIWSENERNSLSDAVTVDVSGAFTAGGAQVAGGTRAWEIELGDDLELIFNDDHKLRVGFEGEFGRVTSDRRDNATGRFVFPSLEAYMAGEPLQFVQRIGDPSLSYSRYEMGWYVYDELRPRKNLQLGFGMRHEFQSFTDDWANFAPRGSIAWTPAALPQTTLRAGAGLFYHWYESSLHEETLRLDGVRQRDLIVMDPGWPDPFAGAGLVELPAPSVVRASEDLRLPQTRRVSIGLEQKLTDGIDVRANVFDEETTNRLRSVDVNAPIDGVRPDPSLARVTEIRSIGRGETRGFDVSLRARSRERGFFGTVHYRYARAYNDADGALSLPVDPSNLAAEWGPASWDIRHRIFSYVRTRLPYGFNVGLSTRANSGAPYTIRTGFDDNGDGVLNDRPAGIGRNSARGEWHAVSDLRLGWMPGDQHQGRPRGDSQSVRRGGEIYAQVSNLFNTTNFTSYSGVMTSPYFGRPTAAMAGRRMELGLRVFF
ncbi:MAG TPA: carboxypeptidase regulatory-like domain-containing protein [Vicinamibacterales bacterium]